MSASLRNTRAAVYTYTRGGSGGRVVSSFTKATNPLAADGNWWCHVAMPTGREVTVGMQPEHRIDVVLEFGPDAPVSDTGALVIDTVEYLIRVVLPRTHGQPAQQVYASRADAPLTIV